MAQHDAGLQHPESCTREPARIAAQVGSLLELIRDARGRPLSPTEAEAIAVLTRALRPLLDGGDEPA